MILRQMEPTDAVQASALWKRIFEDSDAFTEWYFEERFCPAYSFAAFDGDRLISMSLGRPTEIIVDGRTHRALLISGVSTLPAYRGKGLMHALVSMQTERAKADGFACCYLHPVSDALYASLGFQTGTDALRIVSDENRPHAAFTARDGADIPAMRAIYDALLAAHDGMQLRDDAAFSALLRDYATDGGQTVIAYDCDRPVGYLCLLEDGTVSELLALSPDAYAFLLDLAASRIGKPLKAIVPTDCGITGERVYSMQYLVFDNAFSLPLHNGFCRLSY